VNMGVIMDLTIDNVYVCLPAHVCPYPLTPILMFVLVSTSLSMFMFMFLCGFCHFYFNCQLLEYVHENGHRYGQSMKTEMDLGMDKFTDSVQKTKRVECLMIKIKIKISIKPVSGSEK
jgi:hypothetical protein